MAAVRADDAKSIAAMHAADPAAFAEALAAHHPQDELRRTPLMLAYWCGLALAAKALVNAGADYQQPDAAGNSAAWYAQRFGSGQAQAAMSQLIDAGERRLSMEKVLANSPPSAQAASIPEGPPSAPTRRRRCI